MKKLVVFLSGAFATVAMMANACFAATVSIGSAVQAATDEIIVQCSITDPADEQTITITACEADDDTYTNDIIYIDQFVADVSENNTFTFDFLPADWTDTSKAYIVRVGGYGIETPASMVIAFYNDKAYKAGDLDKNGVVDDVDAAILLKYVCGIAELTSEQLTVGDINEDEKVDMLDAIGVLNNTDDAE